MPFCCEHTKKAHEWIQKACNRLMSGSTNETSAEGQIFRSFVPFASTYDKVQLNEAIRDYKEWMGIARDYLQKAEREMSQCRCTNEEKKKRMDEAVKAASAEAKVSGLEECLKEKDNLIKREEKLNEETKGSLKKKEEDLEKKETEFLKVKDEFSELRVEDQKLKDENSFLKRQLKELQTSKLRSQENKLKKLISRLEIDEDEVDNLRDFNKKLIRAKESDEMDKIRKEVREVKKGIKNDLKRREIKYENEKLEKIFSVCEEVVGTQVSLDQIQAYFEVPPRSNLN